MLMKNPHVILAHGEGGSASDDEDIILDPFCPSASEIKILS